MKSSAPPVLHQNGYLYLYEHPSAVNAVPAPPHERHDAWKRALENAQMQRDVGVPLDVFTPEEVESRWPHLNKNQLIGAVFGKGDGFLEVEEVFQRAFQHAKTLGVKINTDTEVLGASVKRGQITDLETTKGSFKVDLVINAANAWAPRVSKVLGGAHLPIQPVKRFLYIYERDATFPKEAWINLPMTIFGTTSGRVAYCRPDNESFMIVGRAHQPSIEQLDCWSRFEDSDQDPNDPGYTNKNLTSDYGSYPIWVNEAMQPFIDQQSKFASLELLRDTTSGFYAITPDKNPIIGWDPHVQNLLHSHILDLNILLQLLLQKN